MSLPSDTPSLDALNRELALYYGGLAWLVEQCYKPGAGMKMLGITQQQWFDDHSAAIDVGSTEIGRMLPVWYRYAYQNTMSAGYDLRSVDLHDDGPMERLRDMIGLLDHEDGYFIDCLTAAQSDDVVPGGLANLVKHVSARSELDSGGDLSLSDLAILAKMSERSVRNAMVAGGELSANERGEIPNAMAKSWLSGRRGFVATVFKGPAAVSTAEVPDVLEKVELPPFIAARLRSLWNDGEARTWVARAARESGLSAARIEAVIQLPFDIQPSEVPALAKALQVDPVWLNHQVMSALYPEQVDMLLNPRAWSTPEVIEKAAAPEAVTVTLTAGMLTHGYIDLPASAAAMFPSNAFGGRGEGDAAAEVTLIYGPHRTHTDIRSKSSKTISPRKRFSAWLNTELGARVGDRIRIAKTGEREYTLSHVAG